MKENIVEIFDIWLNSRLKNIHTSIPGQIQSYSGHNTRKAIVKPMIKPKTRKGGFLEIPPITNVPVIFPSTQEFSMLFPLKKGDGCLILFSEEGMGNFINSSIESNADSFARFNLTDAICVPGLWSFPTVPQDTDFSNNEFILKFKNSIITFDGTDVVVNKGTKGSARVDDSTISNSSTDISFWAFFAAFFGVVTGAPIPEPGSGSPSAFQAALAAAIAGAGGTPTSQTGKINSGSSTVKIG